MCKNFMYWTLNSTYFDDIAYVGYCCHSSLSRFVLLNVSIYRQYSLCLELVYVHIHILFTLLWELNNIKCVLSMWGESWNKVWMETHCLVCAFFLLQTLQTLMLRHQGVYKKGFYIPFIYWAFEAVAKCNILSGIGKQFMK